MIRDWGLFQLHHGECLDVLRGMGDRTVDSIVTDPPYGLSFMGKKWDYDVPSVEIWAECLRVLKPGGHLLAFAGTRTQHRMAVRIEDAGFEIRDLIAWHYASGFPKSLDVGKALDKAAGAEHEVVGTRTKGGMAGTNTFAQDAWTQANRGPITLPVTTPATDAARQWNGWGTALKPAMEMVTLASKPYPEARERSIIWSNLSRLEAQIWLLLFVSAAEKSSRSSQNEYVEAFVTAQWTAEEVTNIRGVLCDQMGTSQFELAANTSLSIASSWRHTLAESWGPESKSTTETSPSTITDLKTLRFSLSRITPDSIILACGLPGGFHANASTAERHFNASLLWLQSTRILFATAPAMWQARDGSLDVDVKRGLDPCVVARKPLTGTVAANILAHGVGALNIDGSRVGDEVRFNAPAGNVAGGNSLNLSAVGMPQDAVGRVAVGRWPANLIHDGSDEVLEVLPSPRFFYCTKASKADRGEGNNHPTVKPTDLMRYLVALVTPPGGTVLDPFMGSGSTGKAAAPAGFRFVGIEREQVYFDLAERRIADAALGAGASIDDIA